LSTNSIIAKELSNDTMINKDEDPRSSGVNALKSRFQRGPPKRRKSNIAAATVWTKYKGQLVTLMESLKKTQSRYIRCIKPNEMKKPLIMQHIPTVEQLRCAGVIAAITISRSAFPNNLPNETVIDRFKSLWPAGKKKSKRKDESKDSIEKALKKDCEKLLDHALECMEKPEGEKLVKAFVVGRTKSYFRTGALEYLESIRLKGLEHKAVELQAHVRMLMAMRRLNKKRQAAKEIQDWWRNNHRGIKQSKKDKKRTSFKELPEIRNIPARVPEDDVETIMNKRKQKKAATKIQAAARGALQRPKYRKMLQEKQEKDRIKKELDDLKKQLDDAEEKRKKDVKAAEAKAQRAIEDYKEEVEEEMEKLREKADEASRMNPKQQAKLDETAGMIDYLRKENARLREANKKANEDFASVKANNKKLNDANAQAAGSFSAMDQNARQLNEANAKILSNLAVYKKQVGTLKDELKSRQSFYLAEAEARLVFQKAMSKMVEMIQDRCNDDQLVEDVIMEALAAQAEAKAHRAGLDYDDAESKPSTGTSSTSKTPTRSAPTPSRSSSRQVDSDSDSDSD
jgi:myosin heavy subunit